MALAGQPGVNGGSCSAWKLWRSHTIVTSLVAGAPKKAQMTLFRDVCADGGQSIPGEGGDRVGLHDGRY